MATVNTTPMVTIEELRRMIPVVGDELTIIVQSEPGVGKTSLLSMMKQDLGEAEYDFIYVDCPVKDMGDVAMNVPVHDTKTLESYVAGLFSLGNGKKKVVLLDEFMKSPKLMQVIYTRLMLERFIGDVPLPKGSIVFGTSNNQSDGVGDTMLAHAGNRVCIVKMQKPSADEWLPWAENNGVHPLIRAWVKMFPKCLHSYLDAGQSDNPYIFNPSKPQLSFCSPRSLAKSSVILFNRDRIGENAVEAALAGTVGQSAAGDMRAFLALDKQLPSFDKILASPATVEVPTEPAALLILMNQAVDKLSSQDELTKFMQFVERIKNEELQAVFFTMMIRSQKGVKLARSNLKIAEWAQKNHQLF